MAHAPARGSCRPARLLLCPLALALLSTAAYPQAPVGDEAVAASLPPPPNDEPDSPWSIQLGALLIDRAAHDGADETGTIAFPLFTIEYGERYFADAIEGLGVRLPTNRPVTLDISLTADLGRPESDSTRLAGLGDIDAGAALKLKASHEHGAFSYAASVERSLSDDEGGFRIDLEAGHARVLGGTLALTPALVARYGSADHLQRYYGVDDARSARSGLDAYFPEQGLASAGTQLTALKLLRSDWILTSKDQVRTHPRRRRRQPDRPRRESVDDRRRIRPHPSMTDEGGPTIGRRHR